MGLSALVPLSALNSNNVVFKSTPEINAKMLLSCFVILIAPLCAPTKAVNAYDMNSPLMGLTNANA